LGTKRGNGAKQLPCALAIFLSAFLLFQVQLLLGKQMLPFWCELARTLMFWFGHILERRDPDASSRPEALCRL
jgi:hypothetical protein